MTGGKTQKQSKPAVPTGAADSFLSVSVDDPADTVEFTPTLADFTTISSISEPVTIALSGRNVSGANHITTQNASQQSSNTSVSPGNTINKHRIEYVQQQQQQNLVQHSPAPQHLQHSPCQPQFSSQLQQVCVDDFDSSFSQDICPQQDQAKTAVNVTSRQQQQLDEASVFGNFLDYSAAYMARGDMMTLPRAAPSLNPGANSFEPRPKTVDQGGGGTMSDLSQTHFVANSGSSFASPHSARSSPSLGINYGVASAADTTCISGAAMALNTLLSGGEYLFLFLLSKDSKPTLLCTTLKL